MRPYKAAFLAIAILLAVAVLFYSKWRSGRIVAERKFTGVTLQVIERPFLQGISALEAIPGCVDKAYEIRIFSNGGQLLTAFQVSWISHEFATVAIENPSNSYFEVLFGDEYIASCQLDYGDMPWAHWNTHAQSR